MANHSNHCHDHKDNVIRKLLFMTKRLFSVFILLLHLDNLILHNFVYYGITHIIKLLSYDSWKLFLTTWSKICYNSGISYYQNEIFMYLILYLAYNCN